MKLEEKRVDGKDDSMYVFLMDDIPKVMGEFAQRGKGRMQVFDSGFSDSDGGELVSLEKMKFELAKASFGQNGGSIIINNRGSISGGERYGSGVGSSEAAVDGDESKWAGVPVRS
ncbi:hypothetical protein AYI70_g11854 [Smittium culicis]|uniref:Uncharacterized protein n=1 Tax=Smittium culicis TaxID=133412 RepID=A0A1R1X032_9FUNG|nr:hypothetical protein AYI70_g11854 [Smittium culicis]